MSNHFPPTETFQFEMYDVGRRPIQGYLAHKKPPPPLGPPQGPMHRTTVGSYGGAVSYERGNQFPDIRRRRSPIFRLWVIMDAGSSCERVEGEASCVVRESGKISQCSEAEDLETYRPFRLFLTFEKPASCLPN